MTSEAITAAADHLAEAVAIAPVVCVQNAYGIGATAAQVRLVWTLQQGPHVLAIPGTGDPQHLEANVAAGALRLTPEEMALPGAREATPR